MKFECLVEFRLENKYNNGWYAVNRCFERESLNKKSHILIFPTYIHMKMFLKCY